MSTAIADPYGLLLELRESGDITDEQFLSAVADLEGRIDVETPPTFNVQGKAFPIHEGQAEIWRAEERVVLGVAGTQGAKTSLAPYLTLREIKRTFRADEPNDHLVASPTYKLQSTKLLPEYRRLFERELKLATWSGLYSTLSFTPEGVKRLTGEDGEIVIRFGHAQDPDSLESATYKSALCDEPGQAAFKEGSIEAIWRRLSIHQGRLFLLTTPYNWGWLKRRFIDNFVIPKTDSFRRVASYVNERLSYRLVRWESRVNPTFPDSEWERSFEDLPTWKFDMFYRGLFTRPAGQVYDSYEPEKIEVEPFRVPNAWPLYVGVDFGSLNTAAVIIAEETKKDWKGNWSEEPTGVYYVIGTYHASQLLGESDAQIGVTGTAKEHIRAIKKIIEALVDGPPKRPVAFGGSHQESGWRESWALSGLNVSEPVFSEVTAQVQTIWTAFKSGKLKVFKGLTKFVDEVVNFSYEIDDETGEPTEKFENETQMHRLAALRYIGTRLFRRVEMGKRAKIGLGLGKQDEGADLREFQKDKS